MSDKKVLYVRMPQELHTVIAALAQGSSMSIQEYALRVLSDHAESPREGVDPDLLVHRLGEIVDRLGSIQKTLDNNQSSQMSVMDTLQKLMQGNFIEEELN